MQEGTGQVCTILQLQDYNYCSYCRLQWPVSLPLHWPIHWIYKDTRILGKDTPDTGHFLHIFAMTKIKLLYIGAAKSLYLTHRIKDKVLILWTKIFACILQTLYCDVILLGHNPLSHVNHWFDLLIIVFMIIRNLLWSIEILLNYND